MDHLKIILKIIFTILFFQLNSCGLKVVENHGLIYGKNLDLNELQIGITTKNEIVELLGSPSTTSNFDNEQSWIYISSEFKKFVDECDNMKYITVITGKGKIQEEFEHWVEVNPMLKSCELLPTGGAYKVNYNKRRIK